MTTAGDRPLVSVVMIAFNVERYIAQAIDSVLSQGAPFAYELIVGEDHSTDGTRAIVEDYARRYPHVVRPIIRPVNLGMNRNFFATYTEARGAYIALLDGDDYWTSPDKLATQVAYLESHRECALCFHNVTVVYDDGTTPHPFHMAQPTPRLSTGMPAATSGSRELAGGNFIQTASVMYRAGLVKTLPAWVFDMPTFDWPLHLLHAAAGSVDYLERTMAAYRVHQGGIWSSGLSYYRTTKEVESMLHAFSLVDAHLQGRYRASMAAPLAFLRSRAMEVSIQNRDYVAAGRYAPYVAAHALGQGRLLGAARALGTWLRAALTGALSGGTGADNAADRNVNDGDR